MNQRSVNIKQVISVPSFVFGNTQSTYYDEEKWSFFKILDSVGVLFILFCAYGSPEPEPKFDDLMYICKYWFICALSDTALECKQASTYIYTKSLFAKIPNQETTKSQLR